MALAPSVQRKIMWLTPASFLEMLARTHPEFVIRLLCHWLNEKNVNIEERFLAPIQIAPVQVAKKFGQLSVLSILNLLRQDESLWQMYAATPGEGVVFNLRALPYIFLQLMFDLGGPEGREKVARIVQKCRVTIGGRKQGEMLQNFKTETVIDLFEQFPQIFNPSEIRMCLMNTPSDQAVAVWLDHWDHRMRMREQPPQSFFWISQLSGERAYSIEKLINVIEFRKKDSEPVGNLYAYKNEWTAFVED